jgi:hypothetical protein
VHATMVNCTQHCAVVTQMQGGFSSFVLGSIHCTCYCRHCCHEHSCAYHEERKVPWNDRSYNPYWLPQCVAECCVIQRDSLALDLVSPASKVPGSISTHDKVEHRCVDQQADNILCNDLSTTTQPFNLCMLATEVLGIVQRTCATHKI